MAMIKIDDLCTKTYAKKGTSGTCYAVACAITLNYMKKTAETDWLSPDDIKTAVGRKTTDKSGMDPSLALEKLGAGDGLIQPKPGLLFLQLVKAQLRRKKPVILNIQLTGDSEGDAAGRDTEHAVVVVGIEDVAAVGGKIWIKDWLRTFNKECADRNKGVVLKDGREHTLVEKFGHLYLSGTHSTDDRIVAAYKVKRPR